MKGVLRKISAFSYFPEMLENPEPEKYYLKNQNQNIMKY